MDKVICVEKMPTAVTADYHPIHNWFNFVAGYAPEYVEMVIENFIKVNKRKPTLVYDPFAGCGTTCVVANRMGVNSIGIERNPFFYRIGYTKMHAKETLKYLKDVRDEFVIAINKEIDLNLVDALEDSAQKYLCKLYDTDSLNRLLYLRNLVKEYNDYKYYMGFTFLSKMMEYVTTAKTDGIYKVPTSIKKSINVEEAIEKTFLIFNESSVLQINDYGKMIYGSSIDYCLDENTCDLIIFSPPYLNNFDFAEMTRMQLYFWEDATNWSEISEKHRNHMLVNTTTALKLVKSKEQQQYLRSTLPEILLKKIDPIVEKLTEIRRVNSKKKPYYLIIYPYLAQMQEVLKNCYRGLRNNGEIHIVVSDAAFYGIHIDTQDYLYDIMRNIGFKQVYSIKMRDRGDRWVLEKRKFSGKQLGEYEVVGKKVE